MASDANIFLNKALGIDFLESLEKFELWKPGTRTTIDHEEIKTALQIVPRVLMSVLVRELSSMAIGDTKEIHIPIDTVPALIRVTKHERDVYSGDIEHENNKVVDFKYRSIPGVGLIIMSAFELYDTSELLKEDNKVDLNTSKQIQEMIDERLALRDLVHKVVDKKIAERDAIQQLLMAKINESLPEQKEPIIEGSGRFMSPKDLEEEISISKSDKKKESPLKNFLENKKQKYKHKIAEFSIEMTKGEHVKCPDCKKDIFDGQAFSGCICLGDDMNKKIYVKKSEDGVKIRFGRGWDSENIEMLLEVLRSKRG